MYDEEMRQITTKGRSKVIAMIVFGESGKVCLSGRCQNTVEQQHHRRRLRRTQESELRRRCYRRQGCISFRSIMHHLLTATGSQADRGVGTASGVHSRS